MSYFRRKVSVMKAGEVIPLLEKDFRVCVISYDGFDETEKTFCGVE